MDNLVMIGVGIFILVLIGIALVKEDDIGYDEMQLKKRANGYRLSFFVTLISLYVFVGLTEFSSVLDDFMSPSYCMVLSGFIGIITFIVHNIFNDAYFRVGQNVQGYIISGLFLLAINTFFLVNEIKKGLFSKDGIISFVVFVKALIIVLVVITLVSVLIKVAISKKEVEE